MPAIKVYSDTLQQRANEFANKAGRLSITEEDVERAHPYAEAAAKRDTEQFVQRRLAQLNIRREKPKDFGFSRAQLLPFLIGAMAVAFAVWSLIHFL